MCIVQVPGTAGFTLATSQAVALVGKLRMSHETHPFWKARQGAPIFSSSFDRDNDTFRRNRHYSPPSSKTEYR
jgi:hypothetical protein